MEEISDEGEVDGIPAKIARLTGEDYLRLVKAPILKKRCRFRPVQRTYKYGRSYDNYSFQAQGRPQTSRF